jgi:hypothetical protein
MSDRPSSTGRGALVFGALALLFNHKYIGNRMRIAAATPARRRTGSAKILKAIRGDAARLALRVQSARV